MNVADNHKSFRLCLPSIRRDPCRRLRSPGARRGTDRDVDAEASGADRFVELAPRSTSSFYRLPPSYVNNELHDHTSDAIRAANCDRNRVDDTATARYRIV